MRRTAAGILTTLVLLAAMATVAAAEQKPVWVDSIRGGGGLIQPMEQKPIWVD